MASTSDELDTLLQDDGYSAAEVIEAATSLLSDPEWAQENPKRVTAVLRATQREDGSQVDAVDVVKFIASVQRVVGKYAHSHNAEMSPSTASAKGSFGWATAQR